MAVESDKRSAVEGRVFDLLVVGAGTAGTVAAYTAAKQGLSVCLVDQKPSEEVGIKTCGDAVVSTHLQKLEKLVGLPLPPTSVIAQEIHGLILISPDEKHELVVADAGYTLDRHAFGQWLIQLVQKVNVVFLDNTKVLRPLLDGKAIIGVKAQAISRDFGFGGLTSTTRIHEQDTFTIRSLVTIDASGVSSVIRKNLPDTLPFGVPKQIRKESLGMCYREIHQLEPGCTLPHPNHCVVHFTKRIAPGGYVWWFPKAQDRVNVGIGFRLISAKLSPYRQFKKFIENHSLLRNSTKIYGSGGVVPLSKPMTNYVGPGFMIVGDAAQQVNPLDGSGIGYSMIGGALASLTLIEAFAARETSKSTENKPLGIDELWPYNVAFLSTEGAKHMGLAVLTTFLNNIRDQDLDFGFANNIITAEDVLRATHTEGGGLKIPFAEKLKRVTRGGRRIGLLMELNKVIKHMKQLSAHYQQFSKDSGNHLRWLGELAKLTEKAEQDLRMALV